MKTVLRVILLIVIGSAFVAWAYTNYPFITTAAVTLAAAAVAYFSKKRWVNRLLTVAAIVIWGIYAYPHVSGWFGEEAAEEVEVFTVNIEATPDQLTWTGGRFEFTSTTLLPAEQLKEGRFRFTLRFESAPPTGSNVALVVEESGIYYGAVIALNSDLEQSFTVEAQQLRRINAVALEVEYNSLDDRYLPTDSPESIKIIGEGSGSGRVELVNFVLTNQQAGSSSIEGSQHCESRVTWDYAGLEAFRLLPCSTAQRPAQELVCQILNEQVVGVTDVTTLGEFFASWEGWGCENPTRILRENCGEMLMVMTSFEKLDFLDKNPVCEGIIPDAEMEEIEQEANWSFCAMGLLYEDHLLWSDWLKDNPECANTLTLNSEEYQTPSEQTICALALVGLNDEEEDEWLNQNPSCRTALGLH